MIKTKDNYQYSNLNTSRYDLIMHEVDKMYFLSPKPVMFVIQNYDLFEQQIGKDYYDRESYKALMSAYMMREYDWEVDTENIQYVPSDEIAYTLIFESLTEVNDNVIVLSPLEKILRYKILASSRNLISIPLLYEDEIKLDFDLLEQYCENAKVLVISNPHYPSGRCFTEDELKKLGEIAKKNNLWILSIEEGGEFTRDGVKYTPISKALNNSSNVITYLSPCKTLNLMDSSMGNLVINNKKFRDFMRSQLKDNSRFSVSAIDVEIFNIFYSRIGNWIKKLKSYVNENFDLFNDYLSKIFGGNLKIEKPESGLLGFIDLSKYGYMPEELEYRILKTGKLTLKFGEEIEGNLQGKIVLNMGYPREMIKEALNRIRKSLS